jgi:nucleoside-diphosphate-sugar epimerase
MSLLYVKTLAEAIVACVLNPKAFGQAFFIADEGEHSWDDFATLVETALDRKTFRIQVPDWLADLVAFVGESTKSFTTRPPLFDKDKVLEARQHRWVVSTAKAERLLGFKPAWTTADAVAETGRWYRDQGWI